MPDPFTTLTDAVTRIAHRPVPLAWVRIEPALAGVRENLGAGPGSGDPPMPGIADGVTVPRPPS